MISEQTARTTGHWSPDDRAPWPITPSPRCQVRREQLEEELQARLERIEVDRGTRRISRLAACRFPGTDLGPWPFHSQGDGPRYVADCIGDRRSFAGRSIMIRA